MSTSEDDDVDDEFDPTDHPRNRARTGSASKRRSLIATLSARRSAARASKKAVAAAAKPALDNGARVQELLRSSAALASPEAVASAQREIVALLGEGAAGISAAEKLLSKLVKAESRVDRLASRHQTRKSGVAKKLLRARHSQHAVHRTPTVTRTLAVGGGIGRGRPTLLDLAYVLTSPRVVALRFAPELAEAERRASSPPGEQDGAAASAPAAGAGASASAGGGSGGGNATARLARYFAERHRGCCRFYNAAAEFTYPRGFVNAMKAAGCGVSNAFALERLLCPTIDRAAAFCRDALDWLSSDRRHSIAVHGGSRWASESRRSVLHFFCLLSIFCLLIYSFVCSSILHAKLHVHRVLAHLLRRLQIRRGRSRSRRSPPRCTGRARRGVGVAPQVCPPLCHVAPRVLQLCAAADAARPQHRARRDRCDQCRDACGGGRSLPAAAARDAAEQRDWRRGPQRRRPQQEQARRRKPSGAASVVPLRGSLYLRVARLDTTGCARLRADSG